MWAVSPPRSFRDPDGFVYQSGSRILRYVHPHAAADVRAFLHSPLATKWTQDGKLLDSSILAEPVEQELPPGAVGSVSGGALVVEHPPVPFRNYPYEWSPRMLRCAATLTLELARNAMHSGFALKDATPYNVMFRGPRPVFLDLLSFRSRTPTESVWQPYAQFVRMFVLPLLAYGYFDMRPDEVLLAHADGIEPERLLALCPLHRRLLPPFLNVVTLPVLLARTVRSGPDSYRLRHAKDADEAAFLLESLFRRAQKLLDRLPVSACKHAGWYMDSGHSYAADEIRAKERFVDAVVTRIAPTRVLDVGSNTGHFSRIAVRSGARVVAIDRDPNAIDALWRAADESALPILPLVVDICRPPGACGWRNSECIAFLDRALGHFDCVLMLAVLHHLLVRERVPLAGVLELASDLTTRWALVEYVDPADANFRQMVRGREELHRDLSPELFESAAGRWFHVVECCPVTATRRIYLLKKRTA